MTDSNEDDISGNIEEQDKGGYFEEIDTFEQLKECESIWYIEKYNAQMQVHQWE